MTEQGSKMVELRIRFWTNDLSDVPGELRPKHVWDGGVVVLKRNEAHDIGRGHPVPWNGFADLPSKIEQVLRDAGITVHVERRGLYQGTDR